MLDLRCLDCKFIENSLQHMAELTDDENNKYHLTIHDLIPKGKVIRLNPFYHDFINTDSHIQIFIKQKYDLNSQPKFLELELREFYNLSSSTVLTLQDTNTLDIYKMKVDSCEDKIGNIETINLHDLNLVIRSMPHYYDKYVIENWIFFNNVIETL